MAIVSLLKIFGLLTVLIPTFMAALPLPEPEVTGFTLQFRLASRQTHPRSFVNLTSSNFSAPVQVSHAYLILSRGHFHPENGTASICAELYDNPSWRGNPKVFLEPGIVTRFIGIVVGSFRVKKQTCEVLRASYTATEASVGDNYDEFN